MKSKRAKEYVKTIKLNKANVDYCLEHGRVNGFLLIDIENAVELAERDAEEKIEALKARTVEVFKRCCIYRSKSEDSDSCFLNDQYNTCDNNCSKVKLLIQILNEQ